MRHCSAADLRQDGLPRAGNPNSETVGEEEEWKGALLQKLTKACQGKDRQAGLVQNRRMRQFAQCPRQHPAQKGIFQPSDFLAAEALGTDMPRRCTSCLKCRECKCQADSLYFKENQEYQVILDSLKFDGARGKWTATYPFRIPPFMTRRGAGAQAHCKKAGGHVG
jgi:hypothetical protein